eukprot:CAMPEP_0201597136 /NCGR_PEP_ID=MMETSP0190_2-20130828/193700_1 /ASSEMBLY_ACC=CAM_ASM_000263 /TAXON_ID=37353 /ORGANISM="Rosalina sp." /LENGTH=214 /DNA_ID=CAMNT_0048057939 /DNA_START=865 /DNA_END=1509 /DNA_ORIENTATION=+
MPQGDYALPMTRHGCPDGFKDSIFYFDDEDSNNQNTQYTSSNFFDYMAGAQGRNTALFFCDSDNSGSGVSSWPSGEYCITKTSSTCPSGFQTSYLYMDDEDDSRESASYGETNVVVSGSKGGIYQFCCRSDGSRYTPVTIVDDKSIQSFALYPKGASCQAVKDYTYKLLTLYHDNEDDCNENSVHNQGYLPKGVYDRNTMIYVCVYYRSGVTFP